MQRPPLCAEHAFMHHLAQRWMREYGMNQLCSRSLKLTRDDIALDQFGHFRADHMCAEQIARSVVEDGLDEDLRLTARARLSITEEREFADLDLPASFTALRFG